MRTPLPPPFRVRLTETPGALVCEMPPLRSARALACSAAHLTLWAVLLAALVEAAVSGAVSGGVATVAGTLVAAGALRAALRAAALHFVREHAVLTHDRFEYVQAVAGRVRVRRFARVHLRDVRAERPEPLEGPRGRVAFGFGAATVRMGRGLGESEARFVAERLRQALAARGPRPADVPAGLLAGEGEATPGSAAAPAGSAWIARPADAQASKSAAARTASADCTRALSMRANLFPN